MGTDNLPRLGSVLKDRKWENLGQGSVRVALELGSCGWMFPPALGRLCFDPFPWIHTLKLCHS